MNKQRRKTINEIYDKIAELRDWLGRGKGRGGRIQIQYARELAELGTLRNSRGGLR